LKWDRSTESPQYRAIHATNLVHEDKKICRNIYRSKAMLIKVTAGMRPAYDKPMKQQTLAMADDQNAQYEQYRKPTKRDAFFSTMEQIVPWAELGSVIEPHYPKAGNGRPSVGLERMLRMYFVQYWFNLADAACEDALLDSTALRRVVGIDLGRERVPDATTLLKFRRLLEKHKLGEALFTKVGEVLQASGLKVGTGTIVDVTITGAPSSTKNTEKKRYPEMHQTRKDQQWFCVMKQQIGVGSVTGLAHSAVVTAANVHDKHPLPQLLYGHEDRVYGDCAYASQAKLIQSKSPDEKDFTNKTVRKGSVTEALERLTNRAKSRGRACVRRRQTALGLRQGALPRSVQERYSRIRRDRPGQYLPGAQAPHGMSASA
jgi:IS5 family transposase